MSALSRLHALAVPGVGATGTQALLEAVLDAAIAISGADFGNLQLLDADSADLVIAVQRGFPAWWVDFWNAVAFGQGACGSALEGKRRILVEDVESSPLFKDVRLLESQRRAGVRAVQSTPLVTRAGQAIGVISTHYRQVHRFAPDTLQWLDLLARQAADLLDGEQAAAAQRRRVQRLTALVTASWDLIYRMDAACSRMWLVAGGGPGSPSPGSRQDWLQHHVHPLDQPRVRASVEQAVAARAGFDLEYRRRRANGAIAWMHARALPLFDGNGELVEWVGAARDVTASHLATAELTEQRNRLQALLQALPLGVAFTDSPGCERVSGNAALLSMFGATASDNVSATAPVPDALGPRVHYRRAGRRVPPSALPLQRAAREGRTVGPVELDMELPDGRHVAIEVTAAPVRDAEGRIAGAVAVLNDTHERHLAEDALEQLRLKDEFLAVVGHELRNPLAAIASLLDGPAGVVVPGPAEPTELIRRQVELLRRQVDDLLDIARLTQGQFALQPQPVSLRALLDAAAQAALPAMRRRSQQLQVDLPAHDVHFSGDLLRLLQVAGNLLDNASKYTPAGGHIELRGRREGNAIVLRCRDDGQGIEAGLIDRIFEPLVRAPRARRAAPGGLGLGLAVTRRLVELHGGSIAARSDGRDHGSEFVIQLPFVAAEGDPPAPAPSPSSPFSPRAPAPAPRPATVCGAAAATRRAPLRTLLVDDHPAVAAATAAQLRHEGLRVETAASGQEALDAARRLRPELLLCDLGLPDMSGLDLIARLRAELADWGSYVVMLTARSQAELQPYKSRAAELGVHEFIAKPLRLDWLHALRDGPLAGRRLA